MEPGDGDRPPAAPDGDGRSRIEEIFPRRATAGLRRWEGADFDDGLARLLALLRAGGGPTAEAAFADFVARAAPALHRDGAALLVGAERDGEMAAGALLLRDGALMDRAG